MPRESYRKPVLQALLFCLCEYVFRTPLFAYFEAHQKPNLERQNRPGSIHVKHANPPTELDNL